jgi:tetratricopeptide (TPR) repeat protein
VDFGVGLDTLKLMPSRYAILCFFAAFSWATLASDMASGQSSELMDAYNTYESLYQQGRYAEAEPYAKEALRLAVEEVRPDPTIAIFLNNLAELYLVQRYYAEAEPLFRRSLEIKEKTLGPEHLDVANTQHNLATLYGEQSRYAEAEALHRRSLATMEKELGPEHPDVATSLNSLAELYRVQGQYAEAEPLLRRSLAGTLFQPNSIRGGRATFSAVAGDH